MDDTQPNLVFEFQQPFARRRNVFPGTIHPLQFVITFKIRILGINPVSGAGVGFSRAPIASANSTPAQRATSKLNGRANFRREETFDDDCAPI
jgi:hypothetical protein